MRQGKAIRPTCLFSMIFQLASSGFIFLCLQCFFTTDNNRSSSCRPPRIKTKCTTKSHASVWWYGLLIQWMICVKTKVGILNNVQLRCFCGSFAASTMAVLEWRLSLKTINVRIFCILHILNSTNVRFVHESFDHTLTVVNLKVTSCFCHYLVSNYS